MMMTYLVKEEPLEIFVVFLY